MEFISEKYVTEALSAREILSDKLPVKSFPQEKYDLGGYLENAKKMPSKYDKRFVFIK